jgi:hypothetical protein
MVTNSRYIDHSFFFSHNKNLTKTQGAIQKSLASSNDVDSKQSFIPGIFSERLPNPVPSTTLSTRDGRIRG